MMLGHHGYDPRQAVNLALATASVGIGTSGAGIIIVVFTVLVALGGWVLVRHYNRRVTGARRDADKIVAYFRDDGIDLSKIIPVARIELIALLRCTMLRSYLSSAPSLRCAYCQHSWLGC